MTGAVTIDSLQAIPSPQATTATTFQRRAGASSARTLAYMVSR